MRASRVYGRLLMARATNLTVARTRSRPRVPRVKVHIRETRHAHVFGDNNLEGGATKSLE